MASYQFAGQFINALLATPLALLPSQAVTVKNLDNTNATLYTGRTKASTASNPVTTDSSGNLAFYVDPGQYILSVTVGSITTTTTVSVATDVLEDSHPYSTPRYGAATSASAAANATAVQAAINAAGASGHRETVWQPRGVWPITTANFNDVPCSIKGDGALGTIYRGDGSADVLTAAHSTETTGINLEDICVTFASASTTKDCIHFGTHVVDTHLTRVQVGSGRYGVRISDNSVIHRLTDCTFGSGCVQGFHGDTGTANVIITGGWFNENTTYGIYHNGVDCQFIGNQFSNTGTGIYLDAGAARNVISGNGFGLTATGSGGIRCYGSHNTISGNYVGNHASIDLLISYTGAGTGANNLIIGNDLGGGTIVLDASTTGNIVVCNGGAVTDNGTGNVVLDLSTGILLFNGAVAATGSITIGAGGSQGLLLKNTAASGTLQALSKLGGSDVLAIGGTSGVDTQVFGGSAGALVATFSTGGVSFSAGKAVITAASATGGAGLRLPHGAAPTLPVDGDMWTTTGGLYVRINGSTVGPLS